MLLLKSLRFDVVSRKGAKKTKAQREADFLCALCIFLCAFDVKQNILIVKLLPLRVSPT
jgi:hypothetical protein